MKFVKKKKEMNRHEENKERKLKEGCMMSWRMENTILHDYSFIDIYLIVVRSRNPPNFNVEEYHPLKSRDYFILD